MEKNSAQRMRVQGEKPFSRKWQAGCPIEGCACLPTFTHAIFKGMVAKTNSENFLLGKISYYLSKKYRSADEEEIACKENMQIHSDMLGIFKGIYRKIRHSFWLDSHFMAHPSLQSFQQGRL